jgi:hypothetical protein
MNDTIPVWQAYADLGRAIARYSDPGAPSVTETRQLVAALVGAHGYGGALSPVCRDAVRRCVDEHAPRALPLSDRLALSDLLLQWAVLAARCST